MTEHQIQNAIIRHLSGRPHLRVFRRNIGTYQDKGRYVRFGTPGQSDLWGFDIRGRHFEIEVKSETGRLTTEQKNWRDTCQAFGVMHVVARSVEDVDRAFKAWGVEL